MVQRWIPVAAGRVLSYSSDQLAAWPTGISWPFMETKIQVVVSVLGACEMQYSIQLCSGSMVDTQSIWIHQNESVRTVVESIFQYRDG